MTSHRSSSPKAPLAGPGHFQWSRGGWFGTQFGGTLWMLLGGGMLFPRSRGAALLWLSCFAISNLVASALWSLRHRLRPYPALMLLLTVLTLCSTPCLLSLRRVRLSESRDLGLPSGEFHALWVFPTLILLFMALERSARKRETPRRVGILGDHSIPPAREEDTP